VDQNCPDRQLLSVYFDGELPSPWKEKMESHIAGCPRCAGRLALYGGNSLSPGSPQNAALEAARERVWQKLEQRAGLEAETGGGLSDAENRRYLPSRPLWRRNISIPIPAAAAVAAAGIILALVLILRTPGRADTPVMSIASESDFDMPGIIPVTDMENVLQYLGSRDGSDILIIRLPESRSFANYGEPAIIKATDYSRQVSGRNIQGWRKP